MFKVDELVKASGGKLLNAGKTRVVSGISTDSRSVSRNNAFIAIRGDKFDGHDYINAAIKRGARCIIAECVAGCKTNPSVASIRVKDTTKALADIAHFHRKKFDIPVIAVCGSNGKTTAKEMIASVLSARYKVLKNFGTENNHIGVPNTLLKLRAQHEVAVIEIGTNHFGEIASLGKIVNPTIGILTNIGPSHLKYLKNLKGVYKEKSALLKYLKVPAIAILNADDPFLAKDLKLKKQKNASFGVGMNKKCEFFASGIVSSNKGLKFKVNKSSAMSLPLLGEFNIYNALFAIACGRILGLRYNDIGRRLGKFSPVANRLNLINFKGLTFINDSYNANPLSLAYALNTLESFETPGRKIAVIADMLELGNREKAFHLEAGRQAARICDYLICVGKRAKFTASAAEIAGLDCDNIFPCDNNKEAREVLFGKISPQYGDIVLLKGSRSMKIEEVIAK